jgi:tRNA 2-thiouridine synthesizing protein E
MTDMVANEILESVEWDADGFLVDYTTWTPELAEAIAAAMSITLTDRHWEVINFARAEFEANDEAPTIRRITKQTSVGTKELYSLFPGGAAKVAARIAGLKKPTGCI